MKRFLGEISLGLAIAAEMTWLWNWVHNQPGLQLHLHFVACIGLGLTFWLRCRMNKAHSLQQGEGLFLSAGAGSNEETRRLLLSGQKIDAIKLHRKNHGGTLREALDYVNAVEARCKSRIQN